MNKQEPQGSRIGLFSVVALVNLLLALILVGVLWFSYHQHHRHSQERAENTALTLERSISGMIDQFDMLLNAVSDELERGLASGHIDHVAVGELLARLAPRIPGLAVVRYSDIAGRVLANTGFPSEQSAISIEDRDYFQYLSKHPNSQLISSKPLLGRTAKKWVIIFALPYHAPGEAFAGVVYASIDLRRFGELFEAVKLGERSRIAMIDHDYARVVAHPMPNDPALLGRRMQQEGVIAQMQTGITTLTTTITTKIDNVERIYAFRKLEARPYWIMAALSVEDEFAPWRNQIWVALLVMLAFASLTGIAGWMVQRGWRQRNEAVSELQASEQRFRDMVNTTDGVVWEADAQTFTFTFISQKAESLLGFSAEDWYKPGFWVENLHPEDKSWAPEYCASCTGRLEPHDFEYRFVAKDGRTVWLHDIVTVVAENGKPRWLRGLMIDITERVAAEAQIRKLSLAVEQSPESIVITNLNAEIEYVNEAFVQKTGYGREDVIGKNPRILHSGKTPPETFVAMWEALSLGQLWKGDLHNRRKDGSEYIEHAVITPIRQPDGTITHYVAVKEDITTRRASEDQIITLAFYDPLTNLPNRRLLLDRLKQALASSGRSKRYGAILFIDLDNFKTLNDTLGHDIGDMLLQQVAQRLITCVREGDTVARLGGDEFVVMLEDLSKTIEESATLSETVGEKILSTLNQPYQLGNYPHHSTPSIGVTLFSDQQETIDELLKRADLAMYQAKAAGRNALRFFDPAMQAVITTRAALEADLREAVQKGQFLPHYQVQVVGESRITGVEVLLRWQHPQRGMVSPADFIPLAEETGLILPLGHWVLQTACAQLALWAARPELANLTIAVNVSARQFHHKDFVDQVQAVLDHTGADPQRLKLELTESLLVDDVEGVIAKMAELKMKGVGFSMDDFGTGYSSLSYLKRLPLDQLKIDQGFVRDILTDANDAAIAKMIIVLAGSLDLTVIAEGVETEPQREFLAYHGCHAYQGYLFSRPLPLMDFERLACKVFDDEQRLLRA